MASIAFTRAASSALNLARSASAFSFLTLRSARASSRTFAAARAVALSTTSCAYLSTIYKFSNSVKRASLAETAYYALSNANYAASMAA